MRIIHGERRYTLSDIRCQSFILDLIDNLPSLSNVPLQLLPVLDIGLQMANWEIILMILFEFDKPLL